VNRIDVIRTPEVDAALIEELAAAIERALGARCRARPDPVAFDVAPDVRRGQVHATAILQQMQWLDGFPERLLAVSGADLFVPVLTFVFGEAQLPGRNAVISTHRLREEFYGLPPDEARLRERLLKLALHELGHTFGLVHCDRWECAMSSSHAVERLDLRRAEYCEACRRMTARSSLFIRRWFESYIGR
jgi:archaemetzincin